MIVFCPRKESPFVVKKKKNKCSTRKKQEEMGKTMTFIPQSSWSSSACLFYYHLPRGRTSNSLVPLPVLYRALNHHRNHLAARSPRVSHMTLRIEEFFFIYKTSIFSFSVLPRDNSMQCLSYTEWITLNYYASFIYNSLLK